MKNIFFSLKELCSQSAMQLKYLRDNPNKKPKITDKQYSGINYQTEIFKKLNDNKITQECGNFCAIENIIIYYSNDIILQRSIIEVKNIIGDYNEYYLQNSLLQCAIYKSFIDYNNQYIYTSKFYENKINDKFHVQLPNNFKYFLLFGNQAFEIFNLDNRNLFDFIFSKALASLDYATAKDFDKVYKHNEFELLKHNFLYKKIGNFDDLNRIIC